jgi:hypothetical protein
LKVSVFGKDRMNISVRPTRLAAVNASRLGAVNSAVPPDDRRKQVEGFPCRRDGEGGVKLIAAPAYLLNHPFVSWVLSAMRRRLRG